MRRLMKEWEVGLAAICDIARLKCSQLVRCGSRLAKASILTVSVYLRQNTLWYIEVIACISCPYLYSSRPGVPKGSQRDEVWNGGSGSGSILHNSNWLERRVSGARRLASFTVSRLGLQRHCGGT